MFIPTTKKELNAIGWESLDVILVTGDTYVDSPYIGVAVIGKVLIDAGYKVGIIAQPDISSENDIGRLGEPNLFWGITSGCMDSMVSNYTATNKYRNKDDLTGGGQNNRRPDMAVIAYTNLVRRYFKKTKPIVIGGIEASLRRISHYHYKSNSIRRSILFDAKADIIVYGMGEKPILEL
ncbi:MAG: YgiQ family radical SAM protein, partial [Desulfobacterales bacterium]|nr:YgiQ family radical SAM protein [Desulfobacterales bacterium]